MPTAVQRQFASPGPFRVGPQYREAAGQTFKMGDLVGLDSSGNVVILVASGSNWDSTSGTKLLGIAGRDAKNLGAVDTEAFPVNLIDMHSVVHLSAWSATPANAEQQDVAYGKVYVIRNQGGIFVLNLDTATNPVATVRNKSEDYAATDQYPVVAIQFHTQANLVHP